MALDSSSVKSPPISYVSPDDDDSIQKVAETITSAFHDAPLMPAFIVEQDHIPPPYPTDIPFARRLEHFEAGITSITKNGAITVYTANFSTIAIWFSPDYAGPAFGEARKRTSSLTHELGDKLSVIERRLFAIPAQHDGGPGGEVDGDNQEKAKVQMRPTWHLSFLARNPDPNVVNVKGGVSAVVRPFVERARRDGVPAWLEATTERNVQIYQHFGFRVEEEVKIGVGRLAADGWPLDGGPGISIWVMVCDEHVK